MKDLLLDTDFDLLIKDGDFVIGESDEQNKSLLLLCVKGDFKEKPDVCVGIENYLESEDPAEMIREIKAQFTGDGMNVRQVLIENGKINIDAKY
jgi:hypothetical protein